MAIKYMKRCSALLIYREIQTKTTVRMAIIKTTKDKMFWQGLGEIKLLFMFNGYFHCGLSFISFPNFY